MGRELERLLSSSKKTRKPILPYFIDCLSVSFHVAFETHDKFSPAGQSKPLTLLIEPLHTGCGAEHKAHFA